MKTAGMAGLFAHEGRNDMMKKKEVSRANLYVFGMIR